MADKKLCLVIGPFGPTKSFEKARAAWLSREIINPVFEAHFPDFVVKNARTYFIPEEIERQVVPDIAEAKLVIVDMPSDLGSMYQLGWCLLNRTPVVFIATGETGARPWRAWRNLKFIFVEQRGNVEQSRHELRSEIERVLGESGLNSLPQPAPATKHELAVRIAGTAAAIADLRVNSTSEHVEQLEKIGKDIENLPDTANTAKAQELSVRALKVLVRVLDLLGSRKGAQILIAGAVGGIMSAGGWPAVTAYTISLAVWHGKDAFMAALDKLPFGGKRRPSGGRKPRKSR